MANYIFIFFNQKIGLILFLFGENPDEISGTCVTSQDAAAHPAGLKLRKLWLLFLGKPTRIRIQTCAD